MDVIQQTAGKLWHVLCSSTSLSLEQQNAGRAEAGLCHASSQGYDLGSSNGLHSGELGLRLGFGKYFFQLMIRSRYMLTCVVTLSVIGLL